MARLLARCGIADVLQTSAIEERDSIKLNQFLDVFSTSRRLTKMLVNDFPTADARALLECWS